MRPETPCGITSPYQRLETRHAVAHKDAYTANMSNVSVLPEGFSSLFPHMSAKRHSRVHIQLRDDWQM